jgi:hypothetical protein
MVVVPEGKHMEPLKLLWNVVDTMDIIDMAIDMTGNYRRVYHVVNGNKGTLTYDNNGTSSTTAPRPTPTTPGTGS